MKAYPKETIVACKVTYTLELEGKFFIIENVPAQVNEETGEQYFSALVVEQLHKKIQGKANPVRIVETPVYDFAA